jgi:lipoic acid synthetase
MLMGDTCTRGCRFCAVKSGNPHGALDLDEPRKVAIALAEMDLTYVVLTSVDRDDLPDGGAAHFARTVREIKARRPDLLVEALIPDFQGDMGAVQSVVDAGVDVLDHNIETVERLQGTVRDRRANYDQSLRVLRGAKGMRKGLFTKSSIMLGLGETREEVLEAMRDLRAAEVDIVTLGQYLRPSDWHLAVQEYVPPETFERFREAGEAMGFAYVAAGPLVRSSYRAGEFFLERVIRDRRRDREG